MPSGDINLANFRHTSDLINLFANMFICANLAIQNLTVGTSIA